MLTSGSRGNRSRSLSVGGVDAARRVSDGEPFDFVVLAADAIEKLAAAGRVDPGSRTDLARSGVAIAVAAGASRPDIGTESALRDAVLHARSIGYSTGPSGTHLVRLFERWGIAEAIAPRIVQASPGVPVATLVARGEVELGFQQLSELMQRAGHRRHRAASTGYPDNHDILGSGMHGVEASGGCQGVSLVPRLTGSRTGEAPPRNGPCMSRRAAV